MSPKELAYVEDALGHESYMRTKCADTVQSLSDSDLKQFVQQLTQRHTQLFNKVYSLV